MRVTHIRQALPDTVAIRYSLRVQADSDFPELSKICRYKQADKEVCMLHLLTGNRRVSIRRVCPNANRLIKKANTLFQNSESELFKCTIKVCLYPGDTLKLHYFNQESINYEELLLKKEFSLNPLSKLKVYNYTQGLEHLEHLAGLLFIIKDTYLSLSNTTNTSLHLPLVPLN